jgi:hypothetical protein
MLLKAAEQLLGTAKRVQESHWEMPKGCWPASEKFSNDIGKPMGNAQYCHHPIGEDAEFPSSYWQKRRYFHPFSMKGGISVHIY